METFFGYAKGVLIPLETVKDDVFSRKILGDGVAVIPEEGRVYAPADGMVASIFDTRHAVCFISRRGTELLIHIGVDTVNLKGKYFTAHVENGASVKQGQLLIEFDRAQIEKAGYDIVIPMIFTNLPKGGQVEASTFGRITVGQVAAIVREQPPMT